MKSVFSLVRALLYLTWTVEAIWLVNANFMLVLKDQTELLKKNNKNINSPMLGLIVLFSCKHNYFNKINLLL